MKVPQKLHKNWPCKRGFSLHVIRVRFNLRKPAADSCVRRKSKRVGLILRSFKLNCFGLLRTQLSAAGPLRMSSYLIAGPSSTVRNVYDMLAAIGKLVRRNKSSSIN